MINPDTKEDINIKTAQAQESVKKAWQVCEYYSRTQKQKYLKELGGYLGTFVNNLRSALNYAAVDYCQQRGFTKTKKGKELNTDFPYHLIEEEFKRIPLVSLMLQTDPTLYTFVEEIQPYHSNKTLLGDIMKISNMDKHKILVKAQALDINSFAIVDADKGFFEPKHLGSAVLIGLSNGKPEFVDTPCYVPQMRMFALRNGKWLNFMIPMDDDELDKHNRLLELIPFLTDTTNKVRRTLSKFYSLWN